MKYILKSNARNSGQYYVEMVGGIIVHVSPDIQLAKLFGSRDEAIAERSLFLPYLERFEVIAFDPEHPAPPGEVMEAMAREVFNKLKGKKD